MEFLGFVLAFVGFFGFIIFLIVFIVMLALKKKKTPFAITMAGCFVSVILGLFLIGKSGTIDNESNSKFSQNSKEHQMY